MKEIWRRAWGMLGRHPVLWVPAILADGIAQVATVCMTAVNRAIFYAMTSANRSVLGGPPDAPSLLSARVTEIVFLSMPVTWGSYFVRALAFALALVGTGVLVWGLERQSPVDGTVVWEAVRSRLRRAAGFAGVLIGICFVGTVVLVGGLVRLLLALDQARLLATPVFSYASALATIGLVSWWMAPRALALVRADGAQESDATEKNMARACTLCAALASGVIQLAATRVWQEFVGTMHPRNMHSGPVFFSALSFLCALPYAALFVALAMIEAERRDAAEEDSMSGEAASNPMVLPDDVTGGI